MYSELDREEVTKHRSKYDLVSWNLLMGRSLPRLE